MSLSLFFWSVTTGNIVLIFATGILFNSFLYAMTNAVWPATYAEIFPTKVRLSGMAIGTQFGFALAGFSPTIAVAIAGDSANGWIPVSIFVVVICLISAHLRRPRPGNQHNPHGRPRHDTSRRHAYAERPDLEAVGLGVTTGHTAAVAPRRSVAVRGRRGAVWLQLGSWWPLRVLMENAPECPHWRCPVDVVSMLLP